MAVRSYELSNFPVKFRKANQYGKHRKSWRWSNKGIVSLENHRSIWWRQRHPRKRLIHLVSRTCQYASGFQVFSQFLHENTWTLPKITSRQHPHFNYSNICIMHFVIIL